MNSLQHLELPVGVEFVREGVAGDDEFAAYRATSGTFIEKGPKVGEPHQTVVKPAPGYEFRWDFDTLAYHAVKSLD